MRISFDPRTKLYLLLLSNLMLFFHVSTVAEAVMTLLLILPFFVAGRWRSGIRFLILYTVLLLPSLFLPVSDESILANLLELLSVGIRMILPCLIAGDYAFTTTSPSQLVCALRRLHIPESIIITCTVIIRFFPTVREDYLQIRSAMALRGIAVGNGAMIRHPAQSLEYILIPLLMNGSSVAQDLSVAALTKGIGLHGIHTCMVQIRMRLLDWLYMAFCTLPILLFLGGVL